LKASFACTPIRKWKHLFRTSKWFYSVVSRSVLQR
jgi:hypothetical protein